MNGTNVIAADTDTVIGAGRHTAGTAQVWSSWASRCAYAFSEAERLVGNARIELAASRYALRVVEGARQVGRLVESLGTDTASAGTLLDGTDAEAAGLLSRPVNSTHVAV